MNFVTLKIIKQNGEKFVIFVIRNVIKMIGVEIGMFSVMKLSFLENEVTK
jgi:anti-anti-sigma regulatory factor